MNDFFADRLGNISIANGVVRMDFISIASLDTDQNQAKIRPSCHLAMPLEGAMQTLEMLEKIRTHIQEQQKKAEQ